MEVEALSNTNLITVGRVFLSLNCASYRENKVKEVVFVFSIYLSLEKKPL